MLKHRCDIGSHVNLRVFTAIREIFEEGGWAPPTKLRGPNPPNIRGGITFTIINPLLRALDSLAVVDM